MNYHMKFFSNSPSFIYQYAALYNIHGYLIYILLEKLDKAYARKLPTKTNQHFEITYDVSIYMACKYLIEHKLRYMSKLGTILTVKKLNRQFFKDMRDFKETQFDLKMFEVNKKISRMEQEQKNTLNLLVDDKAEITNDKTNANVKSTTYAKRLSPIKPKTASSVRRVKRITGKR